MTITVVQPLVDASPLAATTAGTTVFLFQAAYNNSSSVMSTSSPTLGGTAFTGAVKLFDAVATYDSADGQGQVSSAWMLPNVTAGQTSFGLTVTNGTSIGLSAMEVGGLGASPVVDRTALFGSLATPGASVSAGPTSATLYASELILAVLASYGGFSGSPTPSGYTVADNGTHQVVAYQIQTASGNTYSYTQSTTGASALGVVTIAPAGSTANVTPADAAGAADAVTVSVGTHPADVTGAADAVTISVGAHPADAGGAADTVTVSVGAHPADAGGSADILTATVTTTAADFAVAVDSLTAVMTGNAAVAADASGAHDTMTASVTAPAADLAGASETLTVSIMESRATADISAAVDALSVASAVPAHDAAGGAESMRATVTSPVAEHAAAVDSLTVRVSGSAGDHAGAADALTAAVAAHAADVASAGDALTARVSTAALEHAGAVDSLSVQISEHLAVADAAGAADRMTVASSNVAPDVGGAVDSLSVHQDGPFTLSAACDCWVYVGLSLTATIEINVGVPYQGDTRSLAADRWLSMYSS